MSSGYLSILAVKNLKMKKILLQLFTLLLPLFAIAQEEANLLGTWTDLELVGSSWYDNAFNEVWGITVNGHEYAIVGSTLGTHFIDVTDPANPFEAHVVEGASQGDHIIHRDYHDYNGYLYAVCDEGNSTMQIIDISQLPETITVEYDSNEAIRTAHNIFIDTARAHLYAFALDGGPQGYSAMRIYDISEPTEPEFLAEHNQFGGIFAGHVHDGYVRDGATFLNCGNDGFAIVDFTDPQNPETLSTLDNYPHQGYNHSGWLSDDGQYYYMADENHGYDIKVVDVTDPCNAEVIDLFDAEVTPPTSIPHNQLVACNYLYVSYYYDGMIVYDISDPAAPEKVLYYDTSVEPDGSSYKGAWGIFPYLPSGNILVIDMQEGLFVFEGMGDNCDPNAALEPVNVDCLTPTSTDEVQTPDQITVSPVPAREQLNLDINLSSADKVNVQLYNANGQITQSWEPLQLQSGTQQMTLPLANGLTSGLYILKLEGTTVNSTARVIIQ